MDPLVFPTEERSPQPIVDGAENMDVDAGEVNVGPEPMTIDRFQEGKQGSDDEDQEGDFWLNALILQTQTDMCLLFQGLRNGFSCS